MAELMADSAQSVDLPAGHTSIIAHIFGLQFATATVGVDAGIVEREALSCSTELPFVGPYSFNSATIGLASTSVEDEHLVYFAISIPVVLGEVYLVLQLVAGLHHHLLGMHVVALRVVGAVVALVMVQLDGAIYIEGEVEQASALRQEVVVYASLESVGIGESHFVGDAVVEVEGMAFVELHVVVIHQDNQSLLRACIVAIRANAPLRHFPAATGLRAGSSGGSMCLQAGHISQHEMLLSLVHDVLSALCILPIVQVLIAHQLGLHHCSVQG